MKYLFSFFALLGALSVVGQGADPLRAHYSFDDGTANESRMLMEFDGFTSGDPQLACGVAGNALLFDGGADYLTFPGPINDVFGRNDFAVSFYFHPTGVNPRQTLLRKKADCDEDNQRFSINYLATTGEVEIIFGEDANLVLGGENQRIALDLTRCWHHLVVERQNNELRVYLNGERVTRLSASRRFNINNSFNLEIARAGCPTSESNFQGFIDELKLFSGSLTIDDIEALYLSPDRIAEVAFPVINIGEQVQLQVENTCANGFTWTPTASILSGGDEFNPIVAPESSTTYFVEMRFPNSGCRAIDSVLIQVFDPNTFDCTQLLIPTAFTPEGTGPAQNERLSISNAATLQTFEVFEVYDRWGNRVFATTDRNGSWDGTYDGEPAMPGVYLWRVAFGCSDEKLDKTGSVKLLR